MGLPSGNLTFVTTIDKALRVLDAVAETPRPIGLGELVGAVGLPKPTVRRLLLALMDQNLILQNRDKSYELGNSVIDLAARAASSMSMVEESQHVIHELRRNVIGTITLSSFANRSLTQIAQFHPTGSAYIVSQSPGAPLHATAVGKAVLAFVSLPEVPWLLPEKLTVMTPRTVTYFDDLEAELHTIRKRGYATEDEEAQLGVRGVASPIRGFTGRPIGALAVVAAAEIISMTELERSASYVAAAADSISRRFGGTPIAAARRASA